MKVTTKAQREAMYRLWLRAIASDKPDPRSYLAFRRSIRWAFGNCLMVQLWGMWIGIETDGYTHS